jgi:hypothetical protein
MEKYTLMNRFTERFRNRGHQRVRSKEGRFFRGGEICVEEEERM